MSFSAIDKDGGASMASETRSCTRNIKDHRRRIKMVRTTFQKVTVVTLFRLSPRLIEEIVLRLLQVSIYQFKLGYVKFVSLIDLS